MIRTLEIIYNKLHTLVRTSHAIRFLSDYCNTDPTNGLYQDLLLQIKSLPDDYLPVGFIERYCLGKISEYVLLKYPVNVAEAFILSYVALNKPVALSTIYFKLGTSGLISPTVINGVKISDVEAIAQFMIKSLTDVDFIHVTDNKLVVFGGNFSINL